MMCVPAGMHGSKRMPCPHIAAEDLQTCSVANYSALPVY